MKKIVINRCFGGFGLSALAIKRWAELQGKRCYFFKDDFDNNHLEKSLPITLKEAQKDSLFINAYTIPNPDEYLKENKKWFEMDSKEKEAHNKKYEEVSLSDHDIPRDDPLLIQIVEELGSEKASGRCAELKIVSIPDNIDWEIDEYDGSEKIEEKHKSWG